MSPDDFVSQVFYVLVDCRTLIRPPGVKRTNFTLGLEKQKTPDELFARSTTIPIGDYLGF